MRSDAGTRPLGGGLGDHRRTAERLREASRYDQAAVEFQAAKDYAAAAHCFETAGDFEQAAINYLRAGDHAQAGNAYRQAGNPVRAARMYERAGNFAFAAGLFREAGEFGNAARCFQRLGEASSAGEMFERAGQTLQAGESFFEAGMFGRAARLFEDASAWPRAVDAWTAAGDRNRSAAARRRMGARPGGPAGATPAHGTPASGGAAAARDRDGALRDPEALGALFARLAKQGFLTAADERLIERFERTPITRESLPAFLDLVRLYRVVALDDRCRRLCNLIREEAVGVPDLAAALAAASSADAELPSGARRPSPPPFERDASDAWERTGTPSFAPRMTPTYGTPVYATPAHGTPARGTPSLGTPSFAAPVSFDAAPLEVAEIGEGDLFDGRYRIARKLGAGTIGAVFMAFDERLDEHVALKVLKPMSNVGEDVVSRFKQEIKITRKIVHPGVVRTFDFGEYGGLPYLSMEYVDGRDLRHGLREVGRFGLLDGVRIVRAICGALEAAHRLDVIHRDIKPENILLDARGEVKLIDFGIAKIRDAVTAALTETSIGTPEYVSPEMAMGQPVDRHTDIYSVGAVMYEIFCGVPPFRGGGLVSILRRHVAEKPKPPRVLVPEIPPALEATILRALAKDPAQRHDTVSELDQELALVCL